MLLEALRALAAALVIAFLPGYAWSRVLFPRVSVVERLVLSVVLSVSIVTFLLYSGNRFLGFRVSGAQAVLAALFAASVPAAGWAARRLSRSLEKEAGSPLRGGR